jgi:dihydropteroate synthase
MFTLNCGGKLLVLESPVVMAILNATPDSFYKGDLTLGLDGMLNRAAEMLDEGATILDVGGQSTRPGSERLDADTEKKRVIPWIAALRAAFPAVFISCDTYHAEVARAAVEAGASVINDISGGEMDKDMIRAVGELRVPFICTHMQGTPGDMQRAPKYDDVVTSVYDFFTRKMQEASAAGIHDIILDPGFGFGKTVEHNLHLLHELPLFATLGKPVLAGLSRKKTIQRLLDTDAAGALNGTTVMHTLALNNGTSILRVPDVKEAVECIRLVQAYKKIALEERSFLT